MAITWQQCRVSKSDSSHFAYWNQCTGKKENWQPSWLWLSWHSTEKTCGSHFVFCTWCTNVEKNSGSIPLSIANNIPVLLVIEGTFSSPFSDLGSYPVHRECGQSRKTPVLYFSKLIMVVHKWEQFTRADHIFVLYSAPSWEVDVLSFPTPFHPKKVLYVGQIKNACNK